MGNKTSRSKRNNFTELTDDQIEEIVSTTKFSAQQVREWHQNFIRDYPSGKLNRKEFVDLYRQFYPQGKASNFCSLAFNAFDRDHNGFVGFNEFLEAIALTMSSDLKDRLGLAFSMYDLKGDGLLDKKELAQIIKFIYEAHGKRKLKEDVSSKDTARMIIDKFDTDGDGKLSRQEFIDGCLSDTELRKLLTP